ncbi:hypothetical protein AVEN_233912-1 [Araneus ventricosus]|uniref:Endonuclease/exonuclease/phosphatase domain-containing protein n=1 Tax=Araneus ventricosus TaxID=182803 RepID=A0A4Y1ZLH9_ARAVE|nr:hypothetical protein AVEN_233912-1 [Araneus ventricosus]
MQMMAPAGGQCAKATHPNVVSVKCLRQISKSLDMTQTTKGLAICYWNACGITGKMHDFRTFVDEHKPDLLLLQETKLKNNKNIYLPSYLLYRNDESQNPASCGTSIFIKNSISHKEISIPNFSIISATILSINLINQPPIKIASVYVP